MREKRRTAYLMELYLLDGSSGMHFDNICYHECYK